MRIGARAPSESSSRRSLGGLHPASVQLFTFDAVRWKFPQEAQSKQCKTGYSSIMNAITMTEEVENEITLTISRELIDVGALEKIIGDGLRAEQAKKKDPLRGDPYLNTRQAADYMACDVRRIHDLTYRGRLRSVKDGTRVLTRRSWIDAYLKGGSDG